MRTCTVKNTIYLVKWAMLCRMALKPLHHCSGLSDGFSSHSCGLIYGRQMPAMPLASKVRACTESCIMGE